MHRQERDALAILARRQEAERAEVAASTQESLLLRADLLELAAMKQSRELAALRDLLRRQGAALDRLAGPSGDAGGGDDSHSAEALHARLESLERWVLKTARSPS